MKKIDVCLSPDLMHLYEVKEKIIVVVDILRATSCMTSALAHGIDHIKPFAKLDDCLQAKHEGYLTAGERDGKKVEGFDMGNSPFEYMEPTLKGKKIAFTTTNGTQAIAKSEGADAIVIGSFLNLNAVVNFLLKQEKDILVVCAGWKGKVNMEDTLFAGALVDLLQNQFEPACDAPLMAQRLYANTKTDMVAYLQNSSHVKRLARLNIHKDIAFCLTPNQYNVLPIMQKGLLIAKKQS
jgi:2-phosphosulfolactate phosphatase